MSPPAMPIPSLSGIVPSIPFNKHVLSTYQDMSTYHGPKSVLPTVQYACHGFGNRRETGGIF